MARECNILSVTDYRLRPVAEQRARDEKAKRGELADAVGDVRAADEKLAAASARVAKLREAIGHAYTATTATEIVWLDRYRTRLRGQLDAALLDELHARAARDGTAASLEGARDRLALARAARRVVEAHFERWRVEQRKLAERRED
jgi:hypothetical protein